jgi:hypothetical protein
MSVLVKGLFSEDARHYSRQHSGVGVATPSRDKSITPPTSIWYPDPSLKHAMPWRLFRFFFLSTYYWFRIRNVVCWDREGHGWYFSTTARKEVDKKGLITLGYKNVAGLILVCLSCDSYQFEIKNQALVRMCGYLYQCETQFISLIKIFLVYKLNIIFDKLLFFLPLRPKIVNYVRITENEWLNISSFLHKQWRLKDEWIYSSVHP